MLHQAQALRRSRRRWVRCSGSSCLFRADTDRRTAPLRLGQHHLTRNMAKAGEKERAIPRSSARSELTVQLMAVVLAEDLGQESSGRTSSARSEVAGSTSAASVADIAWWMRKQIG
eukprot:3826644-Rhodomonas_salina.1